MNGYVDPIQGLSLRVPPSNVEAEQMLLGALMANNKAYDRVADFLRPDHFADPVHACIYDAIRAGIDDGRVVSAVTLKSVFENSGILDPAGGVPYLAQLLGCMVGVINAGEYGRAIHDSWMRRELIEAGETLINAAFGQGDPNVTAQDILEAHDAALTAIADGAGETAPLIPAGDAVAEALARAEAASKRDSPLAGITTGYAALDRMTAGLQPEQLILIGARPSMGKTALGLGIAVRAAASGAKTLFWSGEMAASQLGARLAAAHAGLSTTSVFTGRGWERGDDMNGSAVPLTAAEWSRLAASERSARRLPLSIDARPAVTVAALRARARRLKRGKGLDLLVVDYIGLMRASPEAERQKLYEKMTDISRGLLALCKELAIPVIAMAQLNRGTEQREDKMPQLSDLRDSGALEQDANMVIFLHRPHYYLSRAGRPERRERETDEAFANRCADWDTRIVSSRGLAQVSLAKNRNGPTGGVRLRFEDRTTWFRDESEADDGPAWNDPL